jgi:hypothetical protein
VIVADERDDESPERIFGVLRCCWKGRVDAAAGFGVDVYIRLRLVQSVRDEHRLTANLAQTQSTINVYTVDDERLWSYDAFASVWHWTPGDLSGKVVREFRYGGNAAAGSGWSVTRDYMYRDGLLPAAITPATRKLRRRPPGPPRSSPTPADSASALMPIEPSAPSARTPQRRNATR